MRSLDLGQTWQLIKLGDRGKWHPGPPSCSSRQLLVMELSLSLVNFVTELEVVVVQGGEAGEVVGGPHHVGGQGGHLRDGEDAASHDVLVTQRSGEDGMTMTSTTSSPIMKLLSIHLRLTRECILVRMLHVSGEKMYKGTSTLRGYYHGNVI